ncbi:MAG: glycoside hydrolase family 5 protein [bacterium]
MGQLTENRANSGNPRRRWTFLRTPRILDGMTCVGVRARSGAMWVIAMVLATACAGGGSVSLPGPTAVPDIRSYPPLPNDAAPGASAGAVAAANAIGRGVNFGNMLEAPTEGAWGLTITDDFIDKAAAAGFTSVRVPVRWSNHAGIEAPFTIDAAFMGRVEAVVDKLLAKGLVVVLNVHHYRQLDGDPLDAGELAVAGAAVDVRFVMLWEQVAKQFQGRGIRLVFELYNEPHGRMNGEPWNVLAARALGVVRKTNLDRIVAIGPTNWNSANDLQLLKLPNDANLIATVHNYAPFRFTHQGAEWVNPVMPVGIACCSAAQQAEMSAPLDLARAWSAAKHYPVFVGEFGAYSKADEASRIAFNRYMRDAMETRGMSWHYWEFAAGFGVYDPAKLSFRQPLLDALLGR